jgi:hypothetical protein
MRYALVPLVIGTLLVNACGLLGPGVHAGFQIVENYPRIYNQDGVRVFPDSVIDVRPVAGGTVIRIEGLHTTLQCNERFVTAERVGQTVELHLEARTPEQTNGICTIGSYVRYEVLVHSLKRGSHQLQMWHVGPAESVLHFQGEVNVL